MKLVIFTWNLTSDKFPFGRGDPLWHPLTVTDSDPLTSSGQKSLGPMMASTFGISSSQQGLEPHWEGGRRAGQQDFLLPTSIPTFEDLLVIELEIDLEDVILIAAKLQEARCISAKHTNCDSENGRRQLKCMVWWMWLYIRLSTEGPQCYCHACQHQQYYCYVLWTPTLRCPSVYSGSPQQHYKCGPQEPYKCEPLLRDK